MKQINNKKPQAHPDTISEKQQDTTRYQKDTIIKNNTNKK